MTFDLNVAGDDEADLAVVLRLVFEHAPGKKATHFIRRPQALQLLWHKPEAAEEREAQALPVAMGADLAAGIVKSWLAETAQYPAEPDTDGDAVRGWRVSSVDRGWMYTFVRIEPWWAVYGK